MCGTRLFCLSVYAPTTKYGSSMVGDEATCHWLKFEEGRGLYTKQTVLFQHSPRFNWCLVFRHVKATVPTLVKGLVASNISLPQTSGLLTGCHQLRRHVPYCAFAVVTGWSSLPLVTWCRSWTISRRDKTPHVVSVHPGCIIHAKCSVRITAVSTRVFGVLLGNHSARVTTGWSSVYSINPRFSHGPSL